MTNHERNGEGSMQLRVLRDVYSICQMDPDQEIPEWALSSSFLSITLSKDELSILCPEHRVPQNVKCETGWQGIEVEGPLAFDQVGILVGLLEPLAAAAIPVFVISTYLTDYIFVGGEHLLRAKEVLSRAGHIIDSNV